MRKKCSSFPILQLRLESCSAFVDSSFGLQQTFEKESDLSDCDY